jgi:hypothetical protein
MQTTLAQAMQDAAGAVHHDRQMANEQFGVGLFDKAVEHHTKRRLQADVVKGTTTDCDGPRARFINWTLEDAANHSDHHRHFVWFSFFRGDVMNSVSRLSRGLEP